MIGPRWRMVVSIISETGFSVGFMLLPGFSYLVRDFRHLQLLMALPAVALLLLSRYVDQRLMKG